MATTSRQSRSAREKYGLLLEQEEFILAATELIFTLMDEAGVTKAELARRVGRSRGYLTQLLDGTRNMTLRTLAEFATALGHRVRLDTEPLRLGPRSKAPKKTETAKRKAARRAAG